MRMCALHVFVGDAWNVFRDVVVVAAIALHLFTGNGLNVCSDAIAVILY